MSAFLVYVFMDFRDEAWETVNERPNIKNPLINQGAKGCSFICLPSVENAQEPAAAYASSFPIAFLAANARLYSAALCTGQQG